MTFAKFLLVIVFSINSFNVLAQIKIKKIKFGFRSTCIIDTSNKLKCWGSQAPVPDHYNNSFGTPILIDVFPAVVDVELAIGFTCALSVSGEVKCWGKVPDAQSDGKDGINKAPFLIQLPSPAKSMASAAATICFVLRSGEVRCLGENNWDDPLKYRGTSAAETFNLPGQVEQLSGDMNNFTVKLIDGSVWRWGNYRAKPYRLNALASGVNEIISSETSHCFLLSSGSVKCEIEKEQFKTIKGLESDAISADVHGESGCAVLNDGSVKCWGYNTNGKLGQSASVVKSDEALIVNGIEGAVSVAIEEDIACAILKNEIVKCWGSGFGMLGNGTETHLPPYELKIP